MYYYRARWYDARTGRFLSRDPIWPDSGFNPYEYVGGSPAEYADPTGLDPPFDPTIFVSPR